MENILRDQLLGFTNIPISITDLSLSLLIAIILGCMLMILRRYSNIASSYDTSFDFSLIYLPAIITLIMIFIGSNLTLSIGLVGSLSVIRFRTVIKNSSDMFYLFWVVAIGLGCGTYNIIQVVYATLFIALFIFIINYFYFSKKKDVNISEAILVINSKKDLKTNFVSSVLDKYKITYKIRSVDFNNDSAEYCYNLSNQNLNLNKDNIVKIIQEINNENFVNNISFISPELKFDN